jgi:hypothetical protein
MMSALRFLDYEVALLLAKYGKSALLKALAQKINLTPEQLESILQATPAPGRSAHPRKKPSASDLVDALAQENPEKAQSLRTLQARFENRSFLPELRDVKRFFDQRHRELGSAKSRVETFPKVLKLLAELDTAELAGLCQSQPEAGRSSLGIISDEILRREK